MKKLVKSKVHPLTAFRQFDEKKQADFKKSLPKAQLGSIVKTVAKYAKPAVNAVKSAMGYTKPAAQNIIKGTKVAVRPVNRAAKPVAKKLDPKIVRRTLNDSRHMKELKRELKSDRKIANVALGVGSTAGAVGTGVLIDSMTDKKAKAKVTPKKK
jgi:hypothetical protein